jgi:hypothetical protein
LLLDDEFHATNHAMRDDLKVKRTGNASSPKRGASDLDVIPVKGGWTVRNGSSSARTRVYPTQAAAAKAATQSLRRNGSGELRVQGRDGRFRESYVVSRNDFEKISAVEGLSLSAEMKRDFEVFDRSGQSDAQRRKAILRKYTKQGV